MTPSFIAIGTDVTDSDTFQGSKSELAVIIGGSVSGGLLILCIAVVVIVGIYRFLKWRTKLRVKRLQMGIFTI